MGEMQELSTFWFVTIGAVKVVAVFTVVMGVVAYMTLAERRVSAFIQDRLGPNRVGPFGLLQPIADGIKNIIKEETMPGTAAKFYFVLGPALAIMPAVVTIAVIPFAAPLPTPVGTVDMVVADVPIGILYILALSSLAVYGIVLSGWASNNKYAFLGGLRASAQMISYEVALGLSVIAVLLLVGNVTLTETVWKQQQLGMWFVFPLSLAFIFFLISALAETNRLPFDMPEAESELITGYHTEYSAMKFSMFFIAEYSHVVTASALLATLFFGGWDIPFWTGDDMFRHEGAWIRGFDEAGAPIPATPSVLITLLTLGGVLRQDRLLPPAVHLDPVDAAALPLRSGHAPGVEGPAAGRARVHHAGGGDHARPRPAGGALRDAVWRGSHRGERDHHPRVPLLRGPRPRDLGGAQETQPGPGACADGAEGRRTGCNELNGSGEQWRYRSR